MSLKCSHKTLIFLSGGMWLLIGLFLMILGIRFLMTTLHNPSDSFSLIALTSRLTSGQEQGASLVIAGALFLGFIKGRTVLKKAAQRQISRILQLAQPAPLKKIYTPAYYLLICGMIALGISLRFLPTSLDVRGAIDLAIGSALINGALHYFRFKEQHV